MSTSTTVHLDQQVRIWLRLEGLAAFVAGAALFFGRGGEWPWFLLLLLAPDISAVGYLGGPRLGAFTYNLAHQWATGLAVLGAGVFLDVLPVALAGAVLVAHTGMDRLFGYGLKLTSSFQDTHLGRIGKHAKRAPADSSTPETATT